MNVVCSGQTVLQKTPRRGSFVLLIWPLKFETNIDAHSCQVRNDFVSWWTNPWYDSFIQCWSMCGCSFFKPSLDHWMKISSSVGHLRDEQVKSGSHFVVHKNWKEPPHLGHLDVRHGGGMHDASQRVRFMWRWLCLPSWKGKKLLRICRYMWDHLYAKVPNIWRFWFCNSAFSTFIFDSFIVDTIWHHVDAERSTKKNIH